MSKTVDAQNIVFVYGALRSGTTVFRLMLDAHPDIANPGEMDFLFDFLHPDPSHPTGWRYDLDALVLNRIFQSSGLEIAPGLNGIDLLQSFLSTLLDRYPGQALSLNLHRHVDRVLATIPDARLIHMLRDPRDVARSSIAMGWAGSLYHGVDHWIGTETEWDTAMEQFQTAEVMTLRYEDLFTDTEEQLEKACNFLRLPFSQQMLRYYENTTYEAPDPSLIAQWRRKSDPYDVALLESKAGSLMKKRGYLPEQPTVSVGRLTRTKLQFANKQYVWTFGAKRFGPAIYFGEKVSRKLKMTFLHKYLKQRINKITLQHLK